MAAKYDKIGIGYNQTRRVDPHLAERVYALLEPKKEGKFLDIGCGTGNYTQALAKKGLDLIGMDPSSEMLGKARNRSDQIRWLQGIAEDTGLP